jgi:tetratricopeptide (TPR) repeat protein
MQFPRSCRLTRGLFQRSSAWVLEETYSNADWQDMGVRHQTKQGSGPSLGRLVVWVAILALAAGASGCGRLKARLQLKDGNQSYLDGDYNAAISHYNKAIRYVPNYAPAYLNMAYSQEALFRAAEADTTKKRLASESMDSFKKYIDLLGHGGVAVDPKGPNRERLEEHILTLLIDSQQYDQAVSYLEDRLNQDPRDIASMELLSRLEMDRGQWDQALEWQRKKVELQPDNPDAQYALGAFVWLYSYRNPGLDPQKRAALLDEGTAALEKALQLRPDDFESLIYINLVYLEKAKYTDNETEKAALQAKAAEFRNRALALRKIESPDTTSSAPADSSAPKQAGGPEPAAVSAPGR